jgi:hypothetical protein
VYLGERLLHGARGTFGRILFGSGEQVREDRLEGCSDVCHHVDLIRSWIHGLGSQATTGVRRDMTWGGELRRLGEALMLVDAAGGERVQSNSTRRGSAAVNGAPLFCNQAAI